MEKPKGPVVDGKKFCIDCEQWRPVDEFMRSQWGTLKTYCRACRTRRNARNPALRKQAERHRHARAANPEKNRIQRKAALILQYPDAPEELKEAERALMRLASLVCPKNRELLKTLQGLA